MRKLYTTCLVLLATVTMTAAAYAGGGGSDFGSGETVVRATVRMLAKLAAMASGN